jgi:hypothetical protein
MENKDITTTIINNEIKVKKPASEAQLRAAKKFYEKNKNSEEYKQKQNNASKKFYEKVKNTEEYKQRNREHAKEQYQKNRENVIARVRLNQKRKQGIEQLERLYELKQQGLITFKDLNDNGYQEILSNLEILGF